MKVCRFNVVMMICFFSVTSMWSSRAFGSLVASQSKEVSESGNCIGARASSLKPYRGAKMDRSRNDLLIVKNGQGFSMKGRVPRKAEYQLWVTYYCGTKDVVSAMDINGYKKEKAAQYMGLETFRKVYLKSGEELSARELKKYDGELDPYYFREYWGTYTLEGGLELQMRFHSENRSGLELRVERVELQRVGRYEKELEPLLWSAIGFYDFMTTEDGFVRNTYMPGKKVGNTSSVATCGVGLMAYSMNHVLGRDRRAEQKALTTLRLFNNKHESIQPQRHEPTGFRHHFINTKTAKSGSEFSTIDTAILVSGALMARNTFNSSEIRSEADELWNSIDWSAAVADIDSQSFHMTGKSMNGQDKCITVLYSEYVLLAYLCQKYEDQQKSGRKVMPDLSDLTKCVYKGRVMLSGLNGHIQPSFLVQFPFYMTNLCDDELFFSYTAAQGWGDRTFGITKNKDRRAWGVSPGCAPSKGYSVEGFHDRNPDNVATPRMIAGFIPVIPQAAEDLYLLWKDDSQRMETDFGTILPRWTPDDLSWRSYRIPGVDFSSWLFGMAAHHPKLGLSFFKEKTQFTFNKK